MRLSTLIPAVLAATLSWGALPVQAQGSYPNKPVRMIVPFAPGGGTDIVARVLAQKLTESFMQNVIVDNRAGGGSTIGTHDLQIVAIARHHGHRVATLNTGEFRRVPGIEVIDATEFLTGR